MCTFGHFTAGKGEPVVGALPRAGYSSAGTISASQNFAPVFPQALTSRTPLQQQPYLYQ
jgi:hypothetical protein